MFLSFVSLHMTRNAQICIEPNWKRHDVITPERENERQLSALWLLDSSNNLVFENESGRDALSCTHVKRMNYMDHWYLKTYTEWLSLPNSYFSVENS